MVATFRVTFPNHSLLDEPTLAWLDTMGVEGLTDSQLLALARMRRGEVLSNERIRATTGLDSRVAGLELRDLVDRGIVQQQGSRRWASYRLVEEAAPTPTLLDELEGEATPSPGEQPVSGAQLPAATDRREQLRRALADGPLSRADLEKITGLKCPSVRYWLNMMRDEGIVELTAPPRSRLARWRLR